MAQIPRDVIEQIRARTDIVELIGAYLPLKRAGQSFKACCPFHDEKTPSFIVTPARQTFHCFGCGERGGAFDFVMKTERVEFPDAARLLADRAGIRIETVAANGQESHRADLYRIHEWAQAFFRRSYATPQGAACRAYVEKRGITPEMIEAFGLGFAPPGWSSLSGPAASKFGQAVLEKCGLVKRGAMRDGFYDTFRDRLTFPIRDTVGRVIAFGARTLDGSEPKYLNSPETEIFHKGRTLFGLERLKQHKRDDPILVMEGYTDVLMSVQVGVAGAVATLGTAMTPDHVRILSRYADRIVLVYDGDNAGLLAAEKAALLLLRGGHLDIKVAVLPDGQDPCDFFLQRGPAGVEDLLDVLTDLASFLLDRSAAHHDVATPEGRRRAAEQLLQAAAAVADPISRELVLGQIAERLRLPILALRERAVDLAARERPAAAAEAKGPAIPAAKRTVAAPGQAQRWLIEALLNEPRLLVERPDVDFGLIPDERVRRLAQALFEVALRCVARTGAPPTTGELLDLLEVAEDRELARRALLEPGHGLDLARRLEDALAYLKNRCRRQEVSRLKDRIEDGGADLLRDLLSRYRELKGRPPPGAGQSESSSSAPEEDPQP